MNSNRTSIIATTIGTFLAFFTFGTYDVLKSTTISSILDEMQYSYSRSGLIILASYFGFVVASLLTGFIAETVGKKTIVFIAIICYLAGAYSYSSSQSLALFILASFFLGFAAGSTELGCMSIITNIHRHSPGLYLNLLTAFHGLGCMLAPLYAGAMFRAGFTWRNVYSYSIIVPLAVLLYFTFARYPKLDETAASRFDFRNILKTAFTPTMRWVYVLCCAYTATEVVIATWLVEYLRILHGVPIESASTWLSIYFGGIMAGRLVGGFLVERVGYMRSIAFAIIACIACILLGVSGTLTLAYLLPVTGLFLSIIFPTSLALVATLGFKNLGPIIGLFLCFVGVGGMIGPWIAGQVNDALGLNFGMGTAVLFCAIMLFALYRIKKSISAPAKSA
jgi:Fucose permease